MTFIYKTEFIKLPCFVILVGWHLYLTWAIYFALGNGCLLPVAGLLVAGGKLKEMSFAFIWNKNDPIPLHSCIKYSREDQVHSESLGMPNFTLPVYKPQTEKKQVRLYNWWLQMFKNGEAILANKM